MKKLLFLSLILCCISCTPKISYLGDSYAPTADVEVYYDEGDIRKEYKVMGLMTADSWRSLEDIRAKMIESAKTKGADAILFRGFYIQESEVDVDKNVIEGKLIKYRN